MFDIGFSELMLVGVVALLVVGPKKLPELARTAGAWLGKGRRMIATVKADIDRELKTDELRKLLTEQQAEVQELRQMLTDTHSGLETDIKKAVADPSPVAKPLSSPVAMDGAARIESAQSAAIPTSSPKPDLDKHG